MDAYICKCRVSFDGENYDEGDRIELPAKHAAPLLDCGAIEARTTEQEDETQQEAARRLRVWAAEQLAAQKADADRLAAEKADADRLAAEKADADRLAAEKAVATDKQPTKKK